jgi:hypothetical protein
MESGSRIGHMPKDSHMSWKGAILIGMWHRKSFNLRENNHIALRPPGDGKIIDAL